MRDERYLGESVNIEDCFFFPGVDLEEMPSFDLEYTLIVELFIVHIVDKKEKIWRESLARLRSKHPIIQLISHKIYLRSRITRPEYPDLRINKSHEFLLFACPIALIVCVPVTFGYIE